MVDRDLARRRALSLFAAFLHFDVSFMVWVLLGPLALFIASDIHLTAAQKGLLVAVPPLGGAFFRIILGLLSDLYGSRRVGICSMAITLVPLVLGWLAGTSFEQLLLVGALLGIAGASFAVSLPLASRWHPPSKQGLAMGIAGAGNFGTIITALSVPRLAAHFGWHATIGFAAIPVLLALAMYAFCASENPLQHPARKASDYAAVIRHGDLWWFCAFYSVTFGGFVGLSQYLAIFFHDQYGVDRIAVGSIVAAAAFAGSWLRPVGGWIADRFGGANVLVVVFAAIGLLALIVASLPALVICELAVFALLGTLGIGNGAVFQVVPQRFRDEIGIVTGIVGAAGGVGGFILPSTLGILKGAMGTLSAGFDAFAMAAFLGAVAIAFVGRSWKLTFLRIPQPQLAYAEE